MPPICEETNFTMAGDALPTNLHTNPSMDIPGEALHSESIDHSDLIIKSARGDMNAFFARPKSDVLKGSVIVIHEIFGLTDHIKDVASRFAQAGFNALAPDLFGSTGELPSFENGMQPVMEYISATSDASYLSDIQQCAAFLRGLETSNGKVGVVGYCWGGRIAMLLAADEPELDASVVYYGRIRASATANQPAAPIDMAPKMNSPLQGHFGELDGAIPVEDIDALRTAMERDAKTAELFVYPGAGHAFNNDTRPMYKEDAAKIAMNRTLQWFKKYLNR